MSALAPWPRSRPPRAAIGALVGALLLPQSASAQVHWDVSAQAGVTKRFLSDRAPQVPQVGLGPTLQLASHVALLPLVHVGGYLTGDIAPWQPSGTRYHGSGGLHLKGFLPIFPPSVRGWIATGFGFAGLHQDGAGTIADAGGHSFEVPLAIGASYKLRKPWSLFAELGGRLAFGHGGAAYGAGDPVDRGAVGLSVGALLDL